MKCCNSTVKDESMLRSLFDLMATPAGIMEKDLMLLLVKKRKDEDTAADLLQAFSFLGVDDRGKIPTDKFADFLQYNGYKYTEEQVAFVLKEADPKNTGFIDVNKFSDLISGKTPKKTKVKPKKDN